MASLTDNLRTDYRGKSTPPVVGDGVSIWEGIAKGASRMLGLVEDYGKMDARNKAAEAKTAETAAKNDLAQGLLDLSNPDPGGMPAPSIEQAQVTPTQEAVENLQTTGNIDKFTNEEVAPPGTGFSKDDLALYVSNDEEAAAAATDAAVGVRTAQRYLAASSQGRMSDMQARIKMQQLLTNLFAKHPANKFVIWEEFKQNAIDHPLFADFKRTMNEADAVDKARVDQNIADVKYYSENYDPDKDPAPDTLSFEEKAYQGSRIRAYHNKFERVVKEAEEARRASAQSDTDTTRVRKNATQSAIAEMDNFLVPSIQTSTQMLTKLALDPSVSDPEKVKGLSNAFNAYRAGGRQIIRKTAADARARLKGNYDEKDLSDWEERKIKELDEVLLPFDPSNPLNVISQNATQLKMIQAQTGLQFEQAAPLFMEMKRQFGNSESMQVFIETAFADPKISKYLKQEMTNFRGLTDPQSRVHLMNAINMIKNKDVNFRDLSEGEAVNAFQNTQAFLLKALPKAAMGNDAGLMQDTLMGLGKMANISVDLPINAKLTTVSSAMNMMGNKSTKALLLKAAKDPGLQEEANLVADGVRAATQKLLIGTTKRGSSDGYFDVVYNQRTMQFEAKWNGKMAIKAPVGVSDPMDTKLGIRNKSRTPYKPQPSAATSMRVRLANDALEFLAGTGEFEDGLPLRQWTMPEQKRFYATGIAPPKKEADGKKAVPFDQMVAKVANFWEKYQVDWSKTERFTFADAMESRGEDVGRVPSEGLEGKIVEGEAGPKGYDSYYGDGQGKGGTDKFNFNLPKPVTQMTIGEAIDFGKRVMIPATRGQIGHEDPTLGTSALGAYQFTQGTLAELAPDVFGDNWRNVKMTPENQDKLAKALIKKTGRDRKALIERWPSLKGKI